MTVFSPPGAEVYIFSPSQTGRKPRWRLKARNGENIDRSEGYKAKSGAQNGIASVGKNAPTPLWW